MSSYILQEKKVSLRASSQNKEFTRKAQHSNLIRKTNQCLTNKFVLIVSQNPLLKFCPRLNTRKKEEIKTIKCNTEITFNIKCVTRYRVYQEFFLFLFLFFRKGCNGLHTYLVLRKIIIKLLNTSFLLFDFFFSGTQLDYHSHVLKPFDP